MEKLNRNPYTPLLVWVILALTLGVGGLVGIVYFHSLFPSVDLIFPGMILLGLILFTTTFVKKRLVIWRIENEVLEEIETTDRQIKFLHDQMDQEDKNRG